jgi:hypothetical protein
VEALLHTPVMITLYARKVARCTATRRHANRCARRTRRWPSAWPMRSVRAALSTLPASGVATLTLAVHTVRGERWHELSARRCRDAVTGPDALLVSEADVTAAQAHRSQGQLPGRARHADRAAQPQPRAQRFASAMRDLPGRGRRRR